MVYDLYGGGYANLLGLQVLAAHGTRFTCVTSTQFTCCATAADKLLGLQVLAARGTRFTCVTCSQINLLY